MAFDPEAPIAALFARLSTLSGLKKKSRRFLHFDDVPQDQQPALIVVGTGGVPDSDAGLPMLGTTSTAMVAFYVREPEDTAAIPESALYDLVKRTRAALTPQNGETQPHPEWGTTLGGLVFSCVVRDYQLHQMAGEKQMAVTLKVEMFSAE
jgi:hypothetical protein